MKQIVVGFPFVIDNDVDYRECSDRQLHEMALENTDAVIYDSPKDFFAELNNNFVNTENMYWFLINIY